MKLENKEICAECGGICCKKCGCDYIPSDFTSLSMNDLLEILEEGNISITSAIFFERLPNGKLYANPYLYLRARNTNRPIVDLFSLKTKCSQLTDNGCRYDINNRPSGGVNLVPLPNMKCYSNIEHSKLMESWKSYQKVLAKLVKRLTGYSVEERLKLDVVNLFDDLINENFDNVSNLEIIDVLNGLNLLIECFKEDYENVKGVKLKIKI